MRLDAYNVGLIAHVAGFTDNDLVISIAVAHAESGFDTNARYVTSQEDSRGLWQINTYAHPNFDLNALYDGMYNGRAAFTVFRNAGYRWTPWTTYTRGNYHQFMDEAYAAVNKMRSIGIDVGVAAPIPEESGHGTFEPAPGPLDTWWDFSGSLEGVGYQFVDSVTDFNNAYIHITSLR